jgi:hypothetical protein
MSTILPHLPNPVVSQHHVTHAMGVAFDEVCRALYLLDDAKAVRIALVAEKIIEHARSGEIDPDRLRDKVLRDIGATRLVPFGTHSASGSNQ